MKRTLTIIIALMAISLISVTVSAQKFVFRFSEYMPSGATGIGIPAKSVVSIEREKDDNFTVVITSQVLNPSIYYDVMPVGYIEDHGLIEIVFAITDTHYLLVSIAKGVDFGAVMELNPYEQPDGDIIVYCNSVEDASQQEAFKKEFNRLNDYVNDNYQIDKSSTTNRKTDNASVRSLLTDQVKKTVGGLPSEVEAVPVSELKSKVLRESKGEIETGIIYNHDYARTNKPISIVGLTEHPLGISSIGWDAILGEYRLFRTLVDQGISFEGLYRRKISDRYGFSTSILLKKTLSLTPKVDFGTFDAVWKSFAAIPQVNLNYDDKTGTPSPYPSFFYKFELSDMPAGFTIDKKKGLKAIEKSFENSLEELRLNGYKVTKRKDYKDRYGFEKDDITGEIYLSINQYRVEDTEMVVIINKTNK